MTEVTFHSSQGFSVGDVVRFTQPPAPKWWRRIEAWRRVFGFKPRTWKKYYRCTAVSGNTMQIDALALDEMQFGCNAQRKPT